MKNLNKRSITTVLIVSFVLVVLGLTGSIFTLAATTPSFGVAATYGVLAGTYTNTSAANTINGDIGFTTGPAAVPLGVHTNYGSGDPTPTARIDAANALSALDTESCDFNFGSVTDLSLLPQPLVPGVYCIAAAASIGTGGITLSGAGTYVFRITGVLTTVDNSVVTLAGGASSCSVFWTPTAATTLGANTTFVGTVIDNANAITVGAHTAWTGRALSLGAGTITTGGTTPLEAVTITVPTCAAPRLTVNKIVVNDNGGTKVIANFPLFIDGGSVTAEVANTTTAGLHTVSETADAGYSTVISGDCAANGTITLALGDVKTCTITNNDIPPVLRLRKTVTNDSGGTALNTAWTLAATGAGGSPTNLSGTTPVDSGATLKADTYTLSESGGPSGYTAGTYSCVKNGGGAVVSNSIILVIGDNATCTIINDDIAPRLTVTKTVSNDDGGTKVISDFPLFIDGGNVTSGVANTTTAGLHTVSETSDPGYAANIGGDCASNGTITLALGDVKICTIANTYIPPSSAILNVIKHVVNDNGGTKSAGDFTLTIGGVTAVGGNTVTGTEFPGVSKVLSILGVYSVDEGAHVGYAKSLSADCSGTIAAGQTKICTITNDDIAPTLLVNKSIINDNGGTKLLPADFSLKLDGFAVTHGAVNTTTIGLHTVSEAPDSGYASVIGGNCAADGTITLALGDVKTCTITNDDIAPSGGGGSYYTPVPPLIDLVKVPSPLALSSGAGLVKYTYTLRNIGTVPVNNVTMVGDTCSPIALISGDTNANARLDVDETWIYTCSANLTKTHTNIVTATGWANGISATDIASATVIVGIPVVPPLIHVTKVPSSFALSAGGGPITYTNKVTNPGTVELSNVSITDDTCSPVKYISGDVNGDSKLDTAETWTYTCLAQLFKTTVNTVTASGDANGLTAKDFAIATVVVAATPAPTAPAAVFSTPVVPKLPNTGIASDEQNIPWNLIVPTGIFVIFALFCFARMKQTV